MTQPVPIPVSREVAESVITRVKELVAEIKDLVEQVPYAIAGIYVHIPDSSLGNFCTSMMCYNDDVLHYAMQRGSNMDESAQVKGTDTLTASFLASLYVTLSIRPWTRTPLAILHTPVDELAKISSSILGSAIACNNAAGLDEKLAMAQECGSLGAVFKALELIMKNPRFQEYIRLAKGGK